MSVKNSEALKTIVLDGVKYVEVREEEKVETLEVPKFKSGDKVTYENYDGSVVRRTISHKSTGGASFDDNGWYFTNGCWMPEDDLTLVEPVASEVDTTEQAEETSVIVITEMNGTKHEIDSGLDVSEFVTLYEDHGAIVDDTLYIPKTNIASITKVVR